MKSLKRFVSSICIALAMLLAVATQIGCGGGGAVQPPQQNCAAAPAAPTGLALAGVTSSSVELYWNSAAPLPNCTVTYSIFQNGSPLITGLGATLKTLTGLSAATSYSFTVVAVDQSGSSSPSAAIAATTNSSSVSGVTSNGITLTGKLLWHSYTNYGFSGVRSWMANFDTDSVMEITPSKVSGAMNYHFNQDGSEVVFMGTDNSASSQAWDIWVASITPTGLSSVTKITNGSSDGTRNEDPKFSSDGSTIIFKKNLDSICSIARSSFTLNGTAQTPAQTVLLANNYESSMPYFLNGSNSNFVFTNDASSNSTIQFDNAGTVTTLYAPANEHAYYPIALNATEFYFSQSDSAGHDQVLLGDINASPETSAAFNDPSYEMADPFPIDPTWLAYTTTRGVAGNYQIWIGDFSSGTTFNLNSWFFGANDSNSNLGPAFFGGITAH